MLGIGEGVMFFIVVVFYLNCKTEKILRKSVFGLDINFFDIGRKVLSIIKDIVCFD